MKAEAGALHLSTRIPADTDDAASINVGDGRSGGTSQLTRQVTLRVDDAAASLGVSRDSFEEHVMPHLKIVRVGRLKLIPIYELERWVEENAVRRMDALSATDRLSRTRIARGVTPHS